MTKYIVDNCPMIKNLDIVKHSCLDKLSLQIHCKNTTDCPIKQVVDKCKKTLDKIYDPLAKEILQTLQVEEVE